MVSVSCPKCGSVLRIGLGGSVKCKDCKTIVYIDTKGNIKKTTTFGK